MYITASGGIHNLQDIEMLDRTGADGVIIGKALYEGAFSIEELVNWNKDA